MDGTTAGNGPGPRTMYPVVKNVMLASADQVAIDAVSAKMMGFDPMSLRVHPPRARGRARHRRSARHRDRRRRRRGAGELELPRRQEPGPRRRRRPDLVRAAEALPEAVLPHAAGQRVHPRQRGLPRLLSLAAGRPQGVRALVRDDGVGPAVPALRAVRAAGRADRRRRAAARSHRARLDPNPLERRRRSLEISSTPQILNSSD